MKLSEMRIELKNEKQFKVLLVVIIFQYWLMYLYDILCYVPGWLLNNIVCALICVLITLPSFFAYNKIGIYKEKIDFKNKKQYMWVLPCTLIFFVGCWLVMGIEISDGYMLPRQYIWCIIYFFFIVAPTEEFIYRVYMLGELSALLGKLKWMAPIISGMVFGLIHIVNMGYQNASMNIVIGIALGYMKLYCKNCTFLTCVLAHGLYDFLITII